MVVGRVGVLFDIALVHQARKQRFDLLSRCPGVPTLHTVCNAETATDRGVTSPGRGFVDHR